MTDPDSTNFTERSTTSWLSRIGSSLIGVLIGLVLLPGAIVLLSWNEGRAVTAAAALKRGLSTIIEIPATPLQPQADGNLVYVAGQVVPGKPAVDPWTSASAEGLLRLRRIVEMYQWREVVHETKTNNTGGSQTTEKTYSYEQSWSATAHNSARFKVPTDHQNPAMPQQSASFQGERIKLGDYTLDQTLFGHINNFAPFKQLKQAPDGYTLIDDSFYRGTNPEQPQIGDIRVRYEAIASQAYSVAAKLEQTTLTTYRDSSGAYSIALLEPGLVTAQQLFADQSHTEKLVTWGLRLSGFLLLVIALSLLLGPLSIVAGFLPFLGSLVGFGTGVLAFGLALPISLFTIAFAWLASRPLIACLAFALGLALLFGVRALKKQPNR